MWGDFTSRLDQVFGGWPNFTQGALGAFVGVLGAAGVAAWVSRREISAERERAKAEVAREAERAQGEIERDRLRRLEAAAQDAAGRMIKALWDLESQVKQVSWAQPVTGSGIESRFLSKWDQRAHDFRQEVAMWGSLLPAALEARLTKLLPLLDRVVVIDTTEEGELVYADVGPEEELDAVRELARSLVSELQAFRRGE
ncbi:hypothetical protein [Phycicoccus sp. Root101]|uniref:hypothetical protein n=1 Tax=Phycicoccus sp. Root101 TaxID=1736421 RepID=UPI000702B1DE|nr:hypothetical protein [Phycicoccus sp. Root101]KQU68308.1 hypothetical protein ASC58_12225 [Phycicoccus sp. Root101]